MTAKNGSNLDPTRASYDEAKASLSGQAAQVGEPQGGDPLQRTAPAAAPVVIQNLYPGSVK